MAKGRRADVTGRLPPHGLRRLFSDERGATAVEYALLISAILLTMSIGLRLVGANISATLSSLATFFASN